MPLLISHPRTRLVECSLPQLVDDPTVGHRRVSTRLDGDMIRLLRNPRLWIWLAVPFVVSGVLFAYPGGPLMAFQDVAEAGKHQDFIKTGEEDGLRMQEELVTVHDRLQRKEELLDAWIDRRLDFRTVCEGYRELNASYPITLRIQREMFGSDVCELELAGMNVVLYLEQHCDSCETPYRLKQRMEQDYKTTFGHKPLPMR
jgi:hypothetical protein